MKNGNYVQPPDIGDLHAQIAQIEHDLKIALGGTKVTVTNIDELVPKDHRNHWKFADAIAKFKELDKQIQEQSKRIYDE